MNYDEMKSKVKEFKDNLKKIEDHRLKTIELRSEINLKEHEVINTLHSDIARYLENLDLTGVVWNVDQLENCFNIKSNLGFKKEDQIRVEVIIRDSKLDHRLIYSSSDDTINIFTSDLETTYKYVVNVLKGSVPDYKTYDDFSKLMYPTEELSFHDVVWLARHLGCATPPLEKLRKKLNTFIKQNDPKKQYRW